MGLVLYGCHVRGARDEYAAARHHWLAKFNPTHEIPLLIDRDGNRIPGNSAVLLEVASMAVGGKCQLRPADAMHYAAAQAALHSFDTKVVGSLYKLFRTKGGPTSEQHIQAISLM